MPVCPYFILKESLLNKSNFTLEKIEVKGTCLSTFLQEHTPFCFRTYFEFITCRELENPLSNNNYFISCFYIALSISDLFSLITLGWTSICFTPAMQTADLIFDPMEVSYLVSVNPHFFFSGLSSWITALIALERCLCVTAALKVGL